ncbi:hypothetical protein [Halobaculum sp. D14]|uniref:hypothetical protein n=1 Tax=Halobaculum sp. D14 TaxID=3421642 RepID=UPI003EB7A7E3
MEYDESWKAQAATVSALLTSVVLIGHIGTEILNVRRGVGLWWFGLVFRTLPVLSSGVIFVTLDNQLGNYLKSTSEMGDWSYVISFLVGSLVALINGMYVRGQAALLVPVGISVYYLLEYHKD